MNSPLAPQATYTNSVAADVFLVYYQESCDIGKYTILKIEVSYSSWKISLYPRSEVNGQPNSSAPMGLRGPFSRLVKSDSLQSQEWLTRLEAFFCRVSCLALLPGRWKPFSITRTQGNWQWLWTLCLLFIVQNLHCSEIVQWCRCFICPR